MSSTSAAAPAAPRVPRTQIGCRVTAVDINEAGIRAGLVLAREAGMQEKVHFQHTDVCEPLPFADHTFDALVCMDVMCHLPNRHRLFDEWLLSCGLAVAPYTRTRSW